MTNNDSFVFVDSKSELTEAQLKFHLQRLGAYAVEFADLSGKSDVYRYVFFVKKALRRTRADKKKLLAGITNWKMDAESLYYNSMDYVIYYHIARKQLPEKKDLLNERKLDAERYLREREGKVKEAFTDCYKPGDKDLYRQLRLAVMYASKHDYILLITDMKNSLLASAFYDALYEGNCEVAAIDFPLMCRQNLPMMRAMALFRETSKG